MQEHQADQGKGGGVDQHPSAAQLPGSIKQAGLQQRGRKVESVGHRDRAGSRQEGKPGRQ
jgi:hypothetical protein